MEPHFGKASGTHFDDLGSLLGSVLETILGTFGVPFLHRFSEGFRDSPKVRDPRKWRLIWVVSGVQLNSYRSKSASLLKVVSLSANQLISSIRVSG